ncbi:hypothetical protein [Mycolicibacter virginiensis]|uniref:hypothetical protein n=1 Tax=Mycolicibacter virginiensis TaxID=1795032 RepID=UPI001F040348|nr:hypothetical protein [Mycolicibacter virginiensis]ULP48614.1 hypothetical protein MJO54_05755 [Mycolicibacter virginiensis]
MSIEDDYYHQRLQNLIDGLAARTRAAIEADHDLWEQPEPDVYELNLTKTSMRIFSRDRDGQKPYYFELYDAHGSLVDTIEDSGWGQPVNLENLYTLVSQGEKQKAREAALQEALNELDISEPPF